MQKNPASKLIPLPPNDLNYKRSFKDWVASNHLQAQYCITKSFYPYNLDIKDAGWGCAWRCIQMILSQHDLPFSQLFLNYGSKQTLVQIYQQAFPDNHSQLQLLQQDNTWAPFDNSSYWAQPFIAQLILFHFGQHSQLVLLNSYPHSAHAPQQVFEKTLSFREFSDKLQKHFNQRKGLIMIDDATYSLVVFGYKKTIDGLQLLIGDPHIKSNREEKNTGMYIVLVDGEGGQIGCSVSQGERVNMMYPSYKAVEFKGKPWMVLFCEN